jgi:uncharacterized protein
MENHYILSHPFAQAAFGGLLIGFASWLLLASLGRVAGISGIAANALFGKERFWQTMFIIGLIGGGALASVLFAQKAPLIALDTSMLQTAVAGLLVGFGTVLGSGCTSGHGVCGIGRRSMRSIVATMVFMAAGIATTTSVHLLK